MVSELIAEPRSNSVKQHRQGPLVRGIEQQTVVKLHGCDPSIISAADVTR